MSEVFINGEKRTIPSSLSEITLQQRIDFQRLHGNELDEILKSIFEIEDEFERELELVEYSAEKMFRTFAFFTGTTPEALKESDFVEDITTIYYSSLQALFEDEETIELQNEFEWNGEMWYLHPIALKNGDKMKFGELVDAKQMVQQMRGLGANKWECMVPLSSICLRKKDEPYQESFLYEGSARQELMKGLPMSIAMHVGFFLTSTQNIWQNTFQSSGLAKSNKAEVMLRSILSNGDGLTYSKA